MHLKRIIAVVFVILGEKIIYALSTDIELEGHR